MIDHNIAQIVDVVILLRGGLIQTSLLLHMATGSIYVFIYFYNS